MSKKELIKFGIKGIDAFQDNYQIFFDRLVRGYRSMMGKDPAGLDLLKVKMEARDKAMQTTKVVDMKGKTLDPNKPITGGTQEGIETIEIERPFGDNIRDAYGKAGRSREEATEMVEALNSPGAKSSYQIMEETLGVRLYGDETFEELMKIKETGVHPRGEPPIKKADGGRIGFKDGNGVADEDAEKAALGKRVRELMDEGYDFGDAVKEAMKEGYKAGGRVGFRGGGADMGADNTASDTGPGGGATDKGSSFTGDSIGPSSPRDLGFIGSGPTVNPNLTKKGPNIISAPNPDPRFDRYNPSTFDPGNRNVFQQGFNLVKRVVTNPFVRNLGFGILGGPIATKFGFAKQMDLFNKVRAVKGLYDSLGPIADQTMEDVLEEETGQTTALYKDGGLVTLFTEKR